MVVVHQTSKRKPPGYLEFQVAIHWICMDNEAQPKNLVSVLGNHHRTIHPFK